MKRAMITVLSIGCSSGSTMIVVPQPDLASATCPNDLPAACPSPSPSWARDVQPTIASACLQGCHQPNGDAFDHPLVTYDDVFTRRSAVIDQVYSCFMPPVGTFAFSLEQRSTMLAWLVCGAPDN